MQKFTTSMHLHNIRFSSPNVISMDICNSSSHNWTISNFSRSTNILTSLIFCCAIKSYIIKVDMIMWGMLKVWPISWIIDLSSSWMSFTSGIHTNISIMENRYTDIHILRKWQLGWGSLQEYTKYITDISICIFADNITYSYILSNWINRLVVWSTAWLSLTWVVWVATKRWLGPLLSSPFNQTSGFPRIFRFLLFVNGEPICFAKGDKA